MLILNLIESYKNFRNQMKELNVYGASFQGRDELQTNPGLVLQFAKETGAEVNIKYRELERYPYHLETKIEGVTILGLATFKEAEELGIIDTCPICGHKKEANADTLAIAK